MTDPETARALLDTRQWRFLSVFMNQEAPLSVAAERLGMSLPALSYRVRKLLRLGLLEVSRVERRKGSPVKHYRAVADHFFVPLEAADPGTLEELIAANNAPFDLAHRRSLARAYLGEAPTWGMNIYRGAGGFNIGYSPLPERGESFTDRSLEFSSPAVIDALVDIDLDFDTAKALQRELAELLQRYESRGSPGKQSYLLRLSLVPLVPPGT